MCDLPVAVEDEDVSSSGVGLWFRMGVSGEPGISTIDEVSRRVPARVRLRRG